MKAEAVRILDHGYLRLVETWGNGDAGLPEAGIIEAARQSTQGSFRGWVRLIRCTVCGREMECENKTSYCNVKPCVNSPMIEVHPGDHRLLTFLFSGKPQHATPFEFCGMVIEVQAPIAVFREWHRHRVQSFEETGFNALDNLDDTAFNEMSARYAPLPDLNYLPAVDRCLRVSATNRQAGAVKGSEDVTPDSAKDWLAELQGLYSHAEEVYQSGLRRGVPKELARLAVSVGRYSRMRVTANLRNWLAFLTLRMDPAAQEEIRSYANAVGDIIAREFPRTWRLFAQRGG